MKKWVQLEVLLHVYLILALVLTSMELLSTPYTLPPYPFHKKQRARTVHSRM